jgi:hypothetical protein
MFFTLQLYCKHIHKPSYGYIAIILKVSMSQLQNIGIRHLKNLKIILLRSTQTHMPHNKT